MITFQVTHMLESARKSGTRDLRRWLRENATSDVLMSLVRNTPAPGTLAWRAARYAACPHDRQQCTGILAGRGYSGHHNAALFPQPVAPADDR